MPARIGFLLFFAVALLGGGCVRRSPDPSPPDVPAIATSTVSVEEDSFPSYRDLFERDAEPDWRTVSFDGFSLSIPYSTEWRLAGIGISIYDADRPIEDRRVIRFGRPSDVGAFVSREYIVYRQRLADPQEADPFERVRIETGCVDGYAAKTITVGGIRGVQYHVGGAKGCALGFAFNLGSHTYYVNKVPDIGQETPDIDPEMERIIQGIRASER